jgi:hypothetical protein
MIKIPLSVIISTVLIVAGIADNSTRGESAAGFCFDEVGDNRFCFNDPENCNEDQKRDETAESNCYQEDSSVVPIGSSSNH